jgi:hypothetical protein
MHRFSNPALEFVAAPALAPAEVSVDPQLMEQYNRELAQVQYSLLFLVNLSSDCVLAGRGCPPPRRRRRLVISPFTYISPVPNDMNPTLFFTTPTSYSRTRFYTLPRSEPRVHVSAVMAYTLAIGLSMLHVRM